MHRKDAARIVAHYRNMSKNCRQTLTPVAVTTLTRLRNRTAKWAMTGVKQRAFDVQDNK